MLVGRVVGVPHPQYTVSPSPTSPHYSPTPAPFSPSKYATHPPSPRDCRTEYEEECKTEYEQRCRTEYQDLCLTVNDVQCSRFSVELKLGSKQKGFSWDFFEILEQAVFFYSG